VIPAHKSKPGVLVRVVAYKLDRVLYSCRAPHVEMNSAFFVKNFLAHLRDARRDLNFLRMQILASQLRQPIQLLFESMVEAFVLIAETRCRRSHLQVEIGGSLGVVKNRAFTALKNLRGLNGVGGDSERGITGFHFTVFVISQSLFLGSSDAMDRQRSPTPRWRHSAEI
jgi:hypothetical protein